MEEQRRAHLQNLEYERLKLEEEKRVAEQEAVRKEEEKESKRASQFKSFETRKLEQDQGIRVRIE